MESTINGRIKQLIKVLKLSNNAFAKSIGKTSTTINFIVDGKTKPSYEMLEGIISAYPNISSDWLMRGEGDMFRPVGNPTGQSSSESADGYLQQHMKQLEDSFARLSQQLEKKDEQLEKKDEQLEKKDEQIGALQRMLEVALGKYNRAPFSRVWTAQDDSKKEVA